MLFGDKIQNLSLLLLYKSQDAKNQYRLTAYLLLRMNLDKIMHTHWDVDASSSMNPRGKCTGQASKSKVMCIILFNSRALSKYAVINLIHTQHKKTSFLCDKSDILLSNKFINPTHSWTHSRWFLFLEHMLQEHNSRPKSKKKSALHTRCIMEYLQTVYRITWSPSCNNFNDSTTGPSSKTEFHRFWNPRMTYLTTLLGEPILSISYVGLGEGNIIQNNACNPLIVCQPIMVTTVTLSLPQLFELF